MQSPRFLLVSLLFAAGKDETGMVTPPTIPRRSLLIWLLAIGVILDIGISIALGIAVHRADQNAAAIRVGKIALYEACIGDNRYRMADLLRWSAVLKLVDDNQSPAARRFVAAVSAVNAAVDEPEKCVKP